jgi:ADP-heptose:LPS heptosyltransferase
VARCLKQQTGATIHFLTKGAFAGLPEPNPHIDRVFSFQKEVTEVLPELRRERYDWVIDLHHNLRSLRVKAALGRPARSFDKLNFRKWLLVRLKWDLLPRRHIVHRYLDTVAHLGVRYDGAGLDHFIPPDQELQPETLAPDLSPGAYTAFVLGATHATKRLTEGQMLEICRRHSGPMALLGGPAEAALGDRLAHAAGPHVINACGRLSLHQSASLIRQSARVLTHDTGLMHIAAAFRKKIVSVWGNTVPAFGMYPFYPDGVDLNKTMEINGLYCRPCSKIGYARCPEGHFRCMLDQPVEGILGSL